MKWILVSKIRGYFSPSFSCFAIRSSGNCQRALVVESGMVRNQMATHSTS
jgi:hypothetical protein